MDTTGRVSVKDEAVTVGKGAADRGADGDGLVECWWLGCGEGVKSGPSHAAFQPKAERRDEKVGLCGTRGRVSRRKEGQAPEAGSTE